MTVRLELKPEIEARLAAQAHARGIPLSTYLQDVLDDLAGAEAGRPVSSLENVRATLDALAEMGRDLPNLPSSAFNRESIYREHD